jgi:hypothetical protein
MQKFGSVATIERQELYISNAKLTHLIRAKRRYGQYCEELLLDFFGATKVLRLTIGLRTGNLLQT